MIVNSPLVNVPVLSKHTMLTLAPSWNATPPPLAKIPFFAANPEPTKELLAQQDQFHKDMQQQTLQWQIQVTTVHPPTSMSK